MLPIRKILCPIDFSDSSFIVLEAACEFAVHFSCELIALHVIAPIPALVTGHISPSAMNGNGLLQEMEESSKRLLEENVAQRVPKGISVRCRIIAGNPAEQIGEAADQENVELIMISTRGQTGLKRLASGSVTEKVVRLSECPVLIIAGTRAKK
ncbi:MAG: universal stress protein [Desulfobacteraceae bacterium]|jgi:nucleotide-binding universal stress UspA family protein|nr:universal stress protein [Desulfobacteraceae bacterium]